MNLNEFNVWISCNSWIKENKISVTTKMKFIILSTCMRCDSLDVRSNFIVSCNQYAISNLWDLFLSPVTYILRLDKEKRNMLIELPRI